MSDTPNDTTQAGPRASLRDLFAIALRHRIKMAVFVVAVISCVAVVVVRAPYVYRSEAKFFVRLGRESVALDPTATTGQIAPVTRSRQSEILTELDILRSRKMAEKLVDLVGPAAILAPAAETDASTAVGRRARQGPGRVGRWLEKTGLRQPLSDRDRAVLTVTENLRAGTAGENSDVLYLCVEAEDPWRAQHLLTTLTDLYLEEHACVHETPGSYEFFRQQTTDARGSLTALEQSLEDLRKDIGVASVDDELKVLSDRIGSLEKEVDQTQASLAAARARARQLEETLAVLPENIVTTTTSGIPNVAVERMRERLYELEMKEQDLVSKYHEESRVVQDIRRQVAEARALLRKEQTAHTQKTTGINSMRQDTAALLLAEQANASSLDAHAEELQTRLAQARERSRQLSDASARMKELQREVQIQEANYKRYAENLEQARIDQALRAERISNIAVLQPATLPIEPIRPRKLLQLLLCVLFAGFGSITLAFVCEYFDHTIKTAQDAEDKLGLPVLACVPRIRSGMIGPAVALNEKNRVYGEGATALGGQWDIPRSVRGYYEVLRQRILAGADGSQGRIQVLAMTGSNAGVGTSAVAANLAAALSRTGGGRVLLMDANIANPSIHRVFGLDPAKGLVDILSDWKRCDEAVVPSPVHNLDILPTGSIGRSEADLLAPAALRNILNHLKLHYRYVVVDLPAVAGSSWAMSAAAMCDGVGLVVEAERSRWQAVQATKEQLQMSRANVIGVVLNKRRFPVPGWLYKAI